MATTTATPREVITRTACFAVNGLWARITSTGKVVGITYTPRTADRKTGLYTPKRMNVRANYTRYLKGGEAAYNPAEKLRNGWPLVLVCDNNALIKGKRKVANGEALHIECIRSFGAEGLLEVRAEGKVYVIVDCLDTKDCDCKDCLESQLPDPYDQAFDR